MAEETIWMLGADGEDVLSVLDEIDGSIQAMSDGIDAAVSGMDESFASLTAAMDDLNAAFEQTDAATQMAADLEEEFNAHVQDVRNSVVQTAEALDGLAASETEAGAGADTATTSMETEAEAATSLGDAIEGAMGPLMMIGMGAVMAGAKFVQMGLDGQKGEELLSGMAGASAQDIQALQVEAMKLGETMPEAAAGFYEVESAGYSGSAAISVFDASMRLAEGGQASAQDTMTALTAIMHDYNARASDATHYTDLMATAVVQGKQSMQDFATSIGPLASAGENVGLSFQQVAAAEATMTQINPSVMRDSQQLTGLFQSLDPAIGGVAKKAQGLHLAFNEAHYASLDLLGKLQYLAEISGGTDTAAFVKLTGGVRGSTAAIDLLKGGAASFKKNLDAMNHSAGATAHAFDSWEGTIPSHLDKVGAALSVFATRFMDAVGPYVIPLIDGFTSAIGAFASFISQHMDIVLPILAALAVILGVVLVAAIGAFLAPLGALVASFAPVIAIVAAVVIGVGLLITHWNQLVSALHLSGPLEALRQWFAEAGTAIRTGFGAALTWLSGFWRGTVQPALAEAGAFLRGVFLASFHAVAEFVQTRVVPAFQTVVAWLNANVVPAFGRVAGFISANFLPAMSAIGTFFSTRILPVLRDVGGFLLSTFAPVWQQLASTVVSQILPMFGQLWGAVKNLLPVFLELGQSLKQQLAPVFMDIGILVSHLGALFQPFLPMLIAIGAVVGGVLVGALGILVGTLSGLARALATFLGGVITAISGVIQTFTGLVQFFSGILAFLVDLFTGHFNRLGGDLGQVFQGILNIGQGFGKVLSGIFQATIGTIVSYVAGFVQGVIGFFQHLADVIIGHSIVPDMLSAMVHAFTSFFANIISTVSGWVADLIGWVQHLHDEVDDWIRMLVFALLFRFDMLKEQATSTLTNLINSIISLFSSLPGKALTWGEDMINGFITGIKNAAGGIGNVVGGVAQHIASFLHFSKPDEGPLAKADTFMPDMMEMFTRDIVAGTSKIKQAVSGVAKEIGTGLSPQGTGIGASGGSFGTSAHTALLQQILQTLQQQGRGPQSGLGPVPPSFSQNNSFTIGGGGLNAASMQELYQLLNQLAGQNGEYAGRGMV